MTLTQVFSHLEPDDAPALAWQRDIGPGDACVFHIRAEGGPRFLYLIVKAPPPQVPYGYLYGDVYSDLSRDPDEPGVAAVHPSEVIQTIGEHQFHAARVTGFRSEAEAVMAIINYSNKRGDA